MENLTRALVLFLGLTTAIYAGDTNKHSVADVMERHHGLSGPVFFVKANHLMANQKMSQSLGIQVDHHPGNDHRNQRLESAGDTTTTYRASRRGPSFSEVSEKYRSIQASSSGRTLDPEKRFTAFRLEDKPTSI